MFVIAFLTLLGVSFAAVLFSREEPSRCGAFTIGTSAIGSCDRIGGQPLSLPAFVVDLIRLILGRHGEGGAPNDI
jgi:hypothetical protein